MWVGGGPYGESEGAVVGGVGGVGGEYVVVVFGEEYCGVGVREGVAGGFGGGGVDGGVGAVGGYGGAWDRGAGDGVCGYGDECCGAGGAIVGGGRVCEGGVFCGVLYGVWVDCAGCYDEGCAGGEEDCEAVGWGWEGGRGDGGEGSFGVACFGDE